MKRGTPDHPKVADLAARLNIEIWGAVGILEMLWHFTAKFAPQGDIGKHSDVAIAKAVHWGVRSGSRGVRTEVRLTSALVEAGFLDRCPCHRLVVHDWKDHADQSVTKMLDRQKLSFVHPPDILPEPEPVASSQSQQPHAAKLPGPVTMLGNRLPPFTIKFPAGGTKDNPDWIRVRDALRAAEPRIRAARNPALYERKIIEREWAG